MLFVHGTSVQINSAWSVPPGVDPDFLINGQDLVFDHPSLSNTVLPEEGDIFIVFHLSTEIGTEISLSSQAIPGATVAYEFEDGRLLVDAYLVLADLIVTNPTSVTVTLIDNTGAVAFTQNTNVHDSGIFHIASAPNLGLLLDRMYSLKIALVHQGETYERIIPVGFIEQVSTGSTDINDLSVKLEQIKGLLQENAVFEYTYNTNGSVKEVQITQYTDAQAACDKDTNKILNVWKLENTYDKCRLKESKKIEESV